jgi:hypothetical protein
MWQVSSRWEPQRAISLLHTGFKKVDLYSARQLKAYTTPEKYEQGWRDMVVANPDNAPAENWVSQLLSKSRLRT